MRRTKMDSTMVFVSSQLAIELVCALHLQTSLISGCSLTPSKHSFCGDPRMVPRPLILICAHGVMDSTMVFGTISEGSNPSGRAKL